MRVDQPSCLGRHPLRIQAERSLINRVAVSLVLVAFARGSYAWNGPEHVEIGTAAYSAACERARTALAADPATPGDWIGRFALACGYVNTPSGMITVYEPLVGEWSALAADHTEKPEQLFDIELGNRVVDYRVMTKIAVTNYRHFHPTSVLSWRADHLRSLEAVAAASKASGIARVEEFERALAVQAFAQHYLHDSFAAGHMGFNRVASSNAAALTHHNTANSRGRCVANLENDTWVTFGDGSLTISDESRRRVIDAADASLYDFLATFISGEVQPDRWRGVWTQFPAFYKDDDSRGKATCSAPTQFQSLRSVSRPAETAVTFDLIAVTDASLWGDGSLVSGVVGGASVEFMYTIPIGYRVIQNRLFVGIGMAAPNAGARPVLLDVSYVWHFATSMRGTLTHDVGFGYLYYFFGPAERRQTQSLRALYALNVEAGRFYIRLQTGYGRSSRGTTGPHAGIGVGWVHRSRR